MFRPNKLWYVSVILICVLTLTIGVAYTIAIRLNSSDALCLQVGDKLLDVQSGQLAYAPAESYVRQLGATIFAVYTSPTLHDTVIVYQNKDNRYGIALLANNRTWVDVQSNKVQQASIAWSPKGQYFSYGDNTTRAVLYDVQARKATSIDGFWYLYWPLDGDYLALRALTPDSTNRMWSARESRFVEPENGLLAGLFTWLSSANSIVYVDPNPTAANKGVLRLLRLDTHTDQELLQLDKFPIVPTDVPPVAISANGKYISVTLDDTIDIFSIDGRLIKAVPIHHVPNMPYRVDWVENRLLIALSDINSFSLMAYDPEVDQSYDLGTVSSLSTPGDYYLMQGEYIAYAETSSQGLYLWTVQTDGSHRVRSQTELPVTTRYFWLGHSLYFHDTTQPYTATWMDTNTGDIHRLPQDPRDTNRDDAADITGQGNLALWANNSSPGPNFLYLLNADKGTLKTLSPNNYIAQIIWSPDGAFIAMHLANENHVLVFDADGRQRAFVNTADNELEWTPCN